MQSSIRISIKGPALTAARPVGRAFAPAQATKTRQEIRKERHRRIRQKVNGTEERPRMAVFRSNENISVQVIDDIQGRTLCAASSNQKDLKAQLEAGGGNIAAAEAVGKKVAELCKEKNITKVAFDRGGFMYHGRIKAVADAAREGGLQF